MTSLDSLLAEVGPILTSSQFAHPSFREVLAARQFMAEISSGQLSMKEAYLNFWSYIEPTKPKELGEEYRTVRPEWRFTLAHIAAMLSDKTAEEFINVISESYFLYYDQIKGSSFFSEIKFYNAVLSDFALCTRSIGTHPALHGQKRVEQVLDALFELARKFSDGGINGQYLDVRCAGAHGALQLTKSQKVAVKLVEYIRWCGSVSDCGYVSDDSKYYSRDSAVGTIHQLVKCGVELPEDVFLDNLNQKIDLNGDCEPIVKFLGYLGGQASLEVLTERLLNNRFLERLIWDYSDIMKWSAAKDQCRDHFESIFKIIKMHEFEPSLIARFNRIISEAVNENLRDEYHSCLIDLAKDFKRDSGLNLYRHLEGKGVQFFDYEVYKPK